MTLPKENTPNKKTFQSNAAFGGLLLLFMCLWIRSSSLGAVGGPLEREAFLNWIQTVPPVMVWISGIVASVGLLVNVLLALLHQGTPKVRKPLWHAAGFVVLGAALIWSFGVWLPSRL